MRYIWDSKNVATNTYVNKLLIPTLSRYIFLNRATYSAAIIPIRTTICLAPLSLFKKAWSG